MAFKQITGRQRAMINNLRDRAWGAGLKGVTFSQIAKNPADWENQIRQAEQAKAEQAKAEQAKAEAERAAAVEAAREAAALAADEVGVKTVDANALIASLRRAGMSVRAIAAAVGVHTSTVYRWARGLFAPIASRYAALTALATEI